MTAGVTKAVYARNMQESPVQQTAKGESGKSHEPLCLGSIWCFTSPAQQEADLNAARALEHAQKLSL